MPHVTYCASYRSSVYDMLVLHNTFACRCIHKCHKAKPTGMTCGAILHYDSICNLAILLEVVRKVVCACTTHKCKKHRGSCRSSDSLSFTKEPTLSVQQSLKTSVLHPNYPCFMDTIDIGRSFVRSEILYNQRIIWPLSISRQTKSHFLELQCNGVLITLKRNDCLEELETRKKEAVVGELLIKCTETDQSVD